MDLVKADDLLLTPLNRTALNVMGCKVPRVHERIGPRLLG